MRDSMFVSQAHSSIGTGDFLKPVPNRARFQNEDYYIWGASVVRHENTFYMLYARWPRKMGHDAWVTHSELAYATADDQLGPYTHGDVVMPERGNPYWDGLCTHNPTVHAFEGRYYLYYMGTRGTSKPREYWNFRNNQSIGVAVADHPAGPWERFDQPIIDGRSEVENTVCCANPTVTRRPDGKYLMIYKAVRKDNTPPFYGPVVHFAAVAETPTGPFITRSGTVFDAQGVDFPAEDPFIWYQDQRYHAIVKDNNGSFTPHGLALVRFVSDDGFDWSLSDEPFITTPRVVWEDGRVQELLHLERPQIYFEGDRPAVLFCAADTEEGRHHSFNVHIPLG
ncbi:glycoside hydrolase family protein [Algisphaera agarilytica]|uniref:Putative GH43/DUF377 family glycosyl hydrolase n=1 Tax=Algisphaera agarilytica TaxID=1385975 RepID=A0A7X0LJ14_9BACT|nr:glycoside hydrolase family protein [Algisphaera agarilytica]MBB6428309.1 putative GH43/DUF377 family glycosyl hydrolase [Algisphaera agarilytica]